MACDNYYEAIKAFVGANVFRGSDKPNGGESSEE